MPDPVGGFDEFGGGQIDNNQGDIGGGQIDNDQGGGGSGTVEHYQSTDVFWEVGGLPILDYKTAVEMAESTGKPLWKFQGKANTFLSPSGMFPGRGWVLMLREDLDQLDVNGFVTLTISAHEEIRFYNLVVCNHPVNLSTGSVYRDPNSTWLVELADLRWLAMNPYFANTIDRGYNVRAPDGGEDDSMYIDSLKPSEEPWSWQEMLDDIWSLVAVPELGTSPTLPFTPSGIPEGFRYHGVPAWFAYNEVLNRLGCAFVLLPEGSTKIVQVGDVDEAFQAATEKYDEALVEDEESQDIIFAKVASSVRVKFHKVCKHYGSERTTPRSAGAQWSLSQTHTVTVDASDDLLESTYQDSSVTIWDDMLAVVDVDGNLQNGPDLQERAEERAEDYYRMVYSGGVRMNKVYDMYANDSGFFPGKQVSGVAWSLQHTARTEIVNGPAMYRVSDKGEWQELEAGIFNENLRHPDLARKTYPNYPLTEQLVRITSATPDPGTGLYSAYVQVTDPDGLTVEDGEACWVWNPNE